MDHPSEPDPREVSLILRALYDHDQEAVGIVSEASQAFETGDDTRAQIEILAAVTAKANCMAAQIIRDWDADEEHKKQLVEHYAALKENMLNDLLGRLNEDGDESAPS